MRKLFLLTAGYVFYGCSDWRYLPLLWGVTLVGYGYGLFYPKLKQRHIASVVAGFFIGVQMLCLGFFKYTNFLLQTLYNVINLIKAGHSFEPLHILLPLGISFYIFQSCGYILDVFKEKTSPERNLLDYTLFAGFFPILLSGPIERVNNLLPQLKTLKAFDYEQAVLGCRQMLWGYLLKMVLADNCAVAANKLLALDNSPGVAVWLGMVFYTFQIYGDFSGYSNIAIGTARLFGINLQKNFDYPYFSQNTVDYWQRWHITLNTWFRDYLYIPLGGSRVSYLRFLINTLVVFALSGLWHGANWTFIFWGVYNAVLVIIFRSFAKQHRLDYQINALSWRCWLRRFLHFLLIVIGWTPFRAENLEICFERLKNMFIVLFKPSFHGLGLSMILPKILPWLLLIIILEWLGFRKQVEVFKMFPQNTMLRWGVYGICCMILFFFAGQNQTFIYFNF